jgi:hypothetical protein
MIHFATAGHNRLVNIYCAVLVPPLFNSPGSGPTVEINLLRSLSTSMCEVTSICAVMGNGDWGVNNVNFVVGTGGGSLYFWGLPNEDNNKEGRPCSAAEVVKGLKLKSFVEHSEFAVTNLCGVASSLPSIVEARYPSSSSITSNSDGESTQDGILLAGDNYGVIRVYRAPPTKASGLITVAEVKLTGPIRSIKYTDGEESTNGNTPRSGSLFFASEGCDLVEYKFRDIPSGVPRTPASYQGKGNAGSGSEKDAESGSGKDAEKYRDAYAAFADEDEDEDESESRFPLSAAAAHNPMSEYEDLTPSKLPKDDTVDEMLKFAKNRKASFVDHMYEGRPASPSLSSPAVSARSGSQGSRSPADIDHSMEQPEPLPTPSNFPSSAAASSHPVTPLSSSALVSTMEGPRSQGPPLPSPAPKRPEAQVLVERNKMTVMDREKEDAAKNLGRSSSLIDGVRMVAREDGENGEPYLKPHQLSKPNLNSSLHYQQDVAIAAGKKFNPRTIKEDPSSRVSAATRAVNFGPDDRLYGKLIGDDSKVDESSIAYTQRVEKQVDKTWLENVERSTPNARDLMPDDAEPVVRLNDGDGDNNDGVGGVEGLRSKVEMLETMMEMSGGGSRGGVGGYRHERRGGLGAF